MPTKKTTTPKINWITCDAIPTLGEQEIVLHLASPVIAGDDVCDRPYFYGAILGKGLETVKFEKDDGSVRDRTLAPFLPFAFEGSEDFLKEVHLLNTPVEDLEKGLTLHSVLRKGTMVRLLVVPGAVHIKGRKQTLTTLIVRGLSVIGWKKLEMEERIEKEQTEAQVEADPVPSAVSSRRRPVPSMKGRATK